MSTVPRYCIYFPKILLTLSNYLNLNSLPVMDFRKSYLFPTRLPVHQRMNANGTGTEWFIFLKQWYNEYNSYTGILHYPWLMHNDTHSVHDRSLKPWWGRLPCSRTFSTSSLLPCLDSTDAHCPLLGAWPPPQSRVPSPRVRAYSPPRVRNNTSLTCTAQVNEN